MSVSNHLLLACLQDKPDVRARLVVGADGLRSAIRRALVPEHEGVRSGW